jgi:hypothetical protein
VEVLQSGHFWGQVAETIEGGTMVHAFVNSDKWNQLMPTYKSVLQTACDRANVWMQAKFDADVIVAGSAGIALELKRTIRTVPRRIRIHLSLSSGRRTVITEQEINRDSRRDQA